MLVLLLLAAGAQAQTQPLAHPELIASDPPEGAVLDAAPTSLTLEFVGPVTPLVARLTSASGKSMLLAPPMVAGNRLTYALPPGLSDGSHLLSWRVTSGKGHAVAGAGLFSVKVPTGAAVPVQPGSWILRSLVLAALVLGLPWLVMRWVKAAALTGFCAALALAWLMPPLIALHLVAVTGWAATWLVPAGAGGRAALRRWLLAAVILTGAALALPQLAWLADWRSDQGRILAIKLLLVAALAALSTRPRQGVLAEARVAMLLVLLAGSALARFAPPPSAEPAELHREIAAGGISAVLEVSPPQTGLVGIRVVDLRLDGVPVTARSMVLELSKPAYGLGPFRVESGPDCGFFDAGRFLLPLDGYWVVKLSVQLDESRRGEVTDLLEIALAT